jgi:hypothetical protein
LGRPWSCCQPFSICLKGVKVFLTLSATPDTVALPAFPVLAS